MNNLDFDNMTIDQLTVALDEEERELLESIEVNKIPAEELDEVQEKTKRID
jgi:hypothetical protein